MIQCKPPVTRWCNNLSLAWKRPVRIKLPLTQIQYLCEVPGFRSAGHIFGTYPPQAESTSNYYKIYIQILNYTTLVANLSVTNSMKSPTKGTSITNTTINGQHLISMMLINATLVQYCSIHYNYIVHFILYTHTSIKTFR